MNRGKGHPGSQAEARRKRKDTHILAVPIFGSLVSSEGKWQKDSFGFSSRAAQYQPAGAAQQMWGELTWHNQRDMLSVETLIGCWLLTHVVTLEVIQKMIFP